MKYRKRPIVIEAFQWTANGPMLWPGWATSDVIENVTHDGKPCLSIQTLEGTMIARPNDWIIRGVNGELYLCKPDIFAATYEPVEEKPC